MSSLVRRSALAALLLASLYAAAVTHVLSASPGAVNFGSQAAGTTVSQAVTVSNTGSGSVQVQSAAISGSTAFQVSGLSKAITLRPGQNLKLTVSFSPAATGSYTGSLQVTGSGGAHVGVSLSGSATGGTAIAVSVSPASASVETGATQQFTATVSGSSNTAVTWLVNGTAGGNSTSGTISAAGLYTAPAAVPPGGSVTVTAQSAADSSKSANASVTITAAATVYSNLDDSMTLDTGGSAYGWGWCGTTSCAGGGSTATQNMNWGVAPSLDGGSAQFEISGSSWADGLWWYKVGPNDAATSFQFDFWLNVGPAAPSYAQALEFDTFQFVSPTRYMFGTQCNYSAGYSSGRWDVWNEGTQAWYHTGLSCPSFVPGDWYRITWSLNRTSDGQQHYNNVAVVHYDSSGSVQLGSSTTAVNLAMPSGPLPSGWGNTMGVQFQLDINGAPGAGTASFTTNVEKVSLTVR